MHIKNRWKAWCYIASQGWKGLTQSYVHNPQPMYCNQYHVHSYQISHNTDHSLISLQPRMIFSELRADFIFLLSHLTTCLLSCLPSSLQKEPRTIKNSHGYHAVTAEWLWGPTSFPTSVSGERENMECGKELTFSSKQYWTQRPLPPCLLDAFTVLTHSENTTSATSYNHRTTTILTCQNHVTCLLFRV